MEIKKQLETSLLNAMRSAEEVRKRTLRLALTAIKLAEVDQKKALDDTQVIGILQKEIKTRQESIDSARAGGRTDLLEAATLEMKILQEYLPAQLTEEEIITLAKTVITETGAATPAEMGKVMKVLLPKIQGRAPSSLVSQVVKNLLDG